jgi:hypothetical protein
MIAAKAAEKQILKRVCFFIFLKNVKTVRFRTRLFINGQLKRQLKASPNMLKY